MRNHPIWRSMLFVPAHVPRFVERAHARGADACVLDLEDSVPLAQKAQARDAVAPAAAAIAAHGTPVLVRVNQPWDLAALDIDAAVGPAVSALVLPKWRVSALPRDRWNLSLSSPHRSSGICATRGPSAVVRNTMPNPTRSTRAPSHALSPLRNSGLGCISACPSA